MLGNRRTIPSKKPMQWQLEPSSRHYSTGYQSDQYDRHSSGSRGSSQGSVDSLLVEDFSACDSSPNPSPPSPRSSASDSEEPTNQRRGWFSKLASNINRSLVKRRARKLLGKLVEADKKEDKPTVAKEQRCDAAAGLVQIMEEELDGEEVVVQAFVEQSSKKDEIMQALLKLSDDGLDNFAYEAISPISTPMAHRKLLALVLEHSTESSFFQGIITPLLGASTEGTAAILYLAMKEARAFFTQVDHQLVFNFCSKVVLVEEPLSPKWYCGVKLLCMLLKYPDHAEWEEKFPSVLELFSAVDLSKFADLIMDMTLHPWVFEFQEADALEKITLKPFSAKDDLCIVGLCSLPDSTFSGALSRQLKEGVVRLNSSNGNLYEPLGLVERLLWLSNTEAAENKIHLALVDGGACEFLAKALNYTGDLARDDRGLWRAKGLAITCLGNIVEMMNREQFFNCINGGMIHSVVAIKEDAAAPLVQRGQAIFLLQRYTLTADRLGVRAFHREDPSESPPATADTTCAYATILEDNKIELEDPNTNPYEPLGLVERLLWLSNIPIIDVEVHRALVKGGACKFLAYVLSHTRTQDPPDRGVWRAKGLAMTCLGNIVQRMDKEHFSLHITKAMVDTVVTIKEHEDVPDVQRGQAILLLKRCTLAADRWGVPPHCREDTSDLPEEFRNMDGNSSRST
ncbi:hypothetical protein FS837_012616 [Tulasnella sp. UAMH 9824]|nr:hypothetical protein FS837_012616 [Tulasnella sp. UAMH 9824]